MSDLGDAVGRIALTIHVQDETGSPILTGSVVALSAAPYIGVGQWLTTKLVRQPRRRVLVCADLVRAAAFLTMTLPVGVGGRLVLLLLASVATPPFDANSGALIPRVVPRDLIGAANGLRTATKEAAFVVGFAAGGLLAAQLGTLPVLAIDAGTFLVSAIVLSRLGASAGRPAGTHTTGLRLADGFVAIRADPVVVRAVVLVAITFSFALIPESLVATYVDTELRSSKTLTGLLASAVAVTVVATALLLKRPEDDRALVRQAATVTAVSGAVAAAAFAISRDVAPATIAYLAIGPMLATRIHCFTVLAHRVEDRLLAPVMSIASGSLATSHVVAGFGGGGVAEVIGVRDTFVLACACAVVTSVAIAGRHGHAARRRQPNGARLKPTDGVRSTRSISAGSDG